MQATKYLCSLVFAFLISGASSLRDDGIAAFHQGRYSIALAKLQAAAKTSPDPTTLTFLALTQAALNDCQSAIPTLTHVPESAGPAIQRMAGLAAAKCYSQSNDDLAAFTTLHRLQLKFPNDPDVLYLTAKLHMKAFNDATFAMFQRAASSYRVHELSAEIFEVENRYPEAVAEYQRAIELNPNAPDLHFRLGRALLLQSHSAESLDQAAKAFQSELELSPEDGACEFQLGQISQVQGNTAVAQAHFERAVALSPTFVQALLSLGKLKADQKHYDEAIQLLSRAAQLQPANEAAHYALLTTYRNTGQMDKAQKEKAILDSLQKPPDGEFSNFLKKLGEKPPEQ
jgi:tetratricopeptide (TPR) repeat protein